MSLSRRGREKEEDVWVLIEEEGVIVGNLGLQKTYFIKHVQQL